MYLWIILAVVLIVLVIVGHQQYCTWKRRKRRNEASRNGIDGSMPVPDQLRIISPFFGMFNRTNVADYADFVKRWGGNGTRIFAYHDPGWDGGGFVPWDGPLSGLTKLDTIRSAIKTFNERGVWVILTLFQNNDAFGQEVVARPRNELSDYIRALCEGTRDLAVIYESTNEDDSHAFNSWVLDEIRKHVSGPRTCAYHNPALGGDWTNYHATDVSDYGNRGLYRIILSNDTPQAIRSGSDADYVRFVQRACEVQPIGSFEILTMWKRLSQGEEGFIGEDIPAMERTWGRVLEAVRSLPKPGDS